MKYAVLEWKNDDVDGEYADVIAKNENLFIAESLVEMTSDHLHREIITMEEYEILKSENVDKLEIL